MPCDHNTVTKTTKTDQYYLVYCSDTGFITAGFTAGQTESHHIIEIFTNVQDLIDRGLELDLNCGVDYLIIALEHGAVFPNEVLATFLGLVWDTGDRNVKAMLDLGYEIPIEEIEEIEITSKDKG